MGLESNNERKTFINYAVWLGIGFLDYVNTSIIYLGRLTPALLEVFNRTLQYVFFPLYAINTAAYVVLAAINLKYDRSKKTGGIKKENVARLAVSILSMLLVGAAVIGSLAFSAAMGTAAMFLFGANLAITGVFNFAGAIYHFRKYFQKKRLLKNVSLSETERLELEENRDAHFTTAVSYVAVGGTIALIALAGALTMLGGFLPLASIGIVAGVIGAAFCIYALVKAIRQHRIEQAKEAELALEAEESLGTTAFLSRELGKQPGTILRHTDSEQDNAVNLYQQPSINEDYQPLLTNDALAVNSSESSPHL